jgi:hypothetical protein
MILVALLSLSSACAGNRAHVDWRPGLTAMSFEGIYEIPLAEYEAFADEAATNVTFDRYRSEAQPGVSEAMTSLGERLAGSPDADPRGYAISTLGGDGVVTFLGAPQTTGPVDWFSMTPDFRWAAIVSKTKLAVATQQASTGIDVGSLLGAGLGGYQFMMVARDDELTVFALPEIGGAVTAHEPGYLFSFRYRPDSRAPWAISVARVSVTL